MGGFFPHRPTLTFPVSGVVEVQRTRLASVFVPETRDHNVEQDNIVKAGSARLWSRCFVGIVVRAPGIGEEQRSFIAQLLLLLLLFRYWYYHYFFYYHDEYYYCYCYWV